MITIFGISNCDTVKKAITWLKTNDIEYNFHDFKKNGLTNEQVQQFASLATWDKLVNKRSTTYRNLSDSLKQSMTDEQAVVEVLKQPTLLKRPLLLLNDSLTLGFSEKAYQELFNQ